MTSEPVPFSVAKGGQFSPAPLFRKQYDRKVKVLYCDNCDCPLQNGVCVGCGSVSELCKREVCDDLDRLGRKVP